MYLQLTIFIIIIAIVIDVIFGELPAKIHPVVWMGKLIDFLSGYLTSYRSKISGIILTFLVVIIFTLATYVLLHLSAFNYILYILISSIILSTTFAIKVLLTSAENMKNDIDHNIEKARQSMSFLVSRNTMELNEEDLVSATIETLTENITDSIIAPLFYAFIFGVPGAVVYRVINTLDAMVGYKTPEKIKIGWFSAKSDDVLNFIPARITGVFIVIAAVFLRLNWKNAYNIMRRDARKPESPNSGFSMAAAAGALDIKLEKIGYYEIGDELSPLTTEKITEAVSLSKITVLLFILVASVLFGIFTVLI
ncbi:MULTISPECIES: cobalamin biosynthesis protein [Methanobacterium]|jgi:adenosylcobinamide-phosphate synthase|uniref:Probable cobalamin biosynthesis protein CobD n=1 Tax=Methanobacterium veterum TaxID=408577 RepID=A0A9E4ZX17_9EURY|nr:MULTISPECIES: cobalamin biosynthesis protein [Methanobacterium]MCZ3365661.1 cobalamin biosynthesis protein [Methanobacterium veterum]MCZ3371125.1 cobalamin biosynthesis protein [Methanobacterium veterum]